MQCLCYHIHRDLTELSLTGPMHRGYIQHAKHPRYFIAETLSLADRFSVKACQYFEGKCEYWCFILNSPIAWYARGFFLGLFKAQKIIKRFAIYSQRLIDEINYSAIAVWECVEGSTMERIKCVYIVYEAGRQRWLMEFCRKFGKLAEKVKITQKEFEYGWIKDGHEGKFERPS